MTGNFSPTNQPRTPPPESAEPACSVLSGAPNPRRAPAYSATQTSSQRPNSPRPHDVRSGGAPRPARPAPAAPVDHREEAIATSVGAPRAPGAAGRICSGHAGQTRRQLQPLWLTNLQHLPPLARTGFAPRAGGGLGAGLPSTGSAPSLEEPEARIPPQRRRIKKW